MSKVTFPLTGNSYSDDGTTGRDMLNGGHTEFLLPMLQEVVDTAKIVTDNAGNSNGSSGAAAASAAAAAADAAQTAIDRAAAAASAAAAHADAATVHIPLLASNQLRVLRVNADGSAMEWKDLHATDGASLIGLPDGSSVADLIVGGLGKVVTSIAALRATDHRYYTQAFVTGYYARGDGGGGAYYYDSSDTTSASNGGSIIVAADGGRWKLIHNGVLSIRQFGAKGDGSLHPLSELYATLALAQVDYPHVTALTQSTDWAAIQASLNSGVKEVDVPQGTYVVNSGATAANTIALVGRGGAIKASGLTANMFNFTGNNCRVANLEIDGSDVSRCGVYYNGAGMTISGNYIHNFACSTDSAVAVEGETNQGSTIIGNRIEYVYATANGTIGDGPGASRAIEIHTTVAAVGGTVIDGNRIAHITGEEGDAIQLLFFDGTNFPFLPSQVSITGNTITDYSRRAIKVQASDVIISGNSIRNDNTYSNPAFGINVISSSFVTVTGNTVRSNYPCFSSSGSATYSNHNVIAVGNTFIATSNNDVCTYHNYNTQFVMRDNMLSGGSTSIAVSNINNSDISGNTITGGPAANQGIQFIGDGVGNNVIQGNRMLGAYTWFMVLSGINNVVQSNFSVTQGINTNVNNTNCVFTDNVAAGGVAVYGDFTAQMLFNNRRLSGGVSGSSGAGVGQVFFSTDNPTTLNPSKWYSRGDIALNASPTTGGKTIGWVCTNATTASTAATWQTLTSA